MKDLAPETREALKFYDENYEIIVNIELPLDAHKRVFIGTSEPRSCRYCGATNKSAFRKVSHTLPEALGNKCLISQDECDECNRKFGNSLDDHFAKFLGLYRTLHQIQGKRGVPTYGVPGRQPRLRHIGQNQFAAEAHLEENFIEIDKLGQKGRIKGFKQPYRKKSVFKCLVKIALAILPEEEIGKFRETFDWVRRDDPIQSGSSTNYFCFTSSMDMKRNGIDLLLMRRRVQSAKLPYMSFYLCFSTLTFQISLPFSQDDQHFCGQTIDVIGLPNRAEVITNVSYGCLDLSSHTLVHDEPDNVEFEIGKPGVTVKRVQGI